MESLSKSYRHLGERVGRFMAEMHRYDGGRTGPLLHAARLTTPQLAVLELVREPKTISAVATHLGLSRPATSQLVDKLVRKQLIVRTQSRGDRRERNAVLSAKGRSLLDRVAAARAARLDAAVAILPRELAARLGAVLADVVDALKAGRLAKEVTR